MAFQSQTIIESSSIMDYRNYHGTNRVGRFTPRKKKKKKVDTTTTRTLHTHTYTHPHKQVYSLAFNADIGALGAILFVVACIDTLVNPFVGYIQDNEWLSSYFSKEKYGRRAPFYITHAPIMIISTALVFFPIKGENESANAGTYIWFTVLLVVMKWCHSVQSIAVGAATDEIFPIQMERSHIWTLNVIFLWIGIMIAVTSSNLTIGDSDNSPHRCCSSEYDTNLPIFCEKVFNETLNVTQYIIEDKVGFNASNTVVVVLMFSCISIIGFVCAASPLKAAKQPATTKGADSFTSFWKNMKYYMKWKAFRALMAQSFFESISNSLMTSLSPFYLTFVVGLNRDEYASTMILTVMTGMIMQIVSAIVCNLVYGTKSKSKDSKTISRHPRNMSIINLVLLAIVTPICVSLADDGYEDDGVTKKKGLYVFVLIGFSLVCLFEHPANMYGGGIARGWLVDVEVQQNSRRTEAQINSLLMVPINIGGILATALLSSLSVAGLDTSKCWGENQDKSSVAYLKYLYMIGFSVCAIGRAVAIYTFPLKENEVAEIEKCQRDVYVKQAGASSGGGGSKVVPSSS